MEWFIHSQGQQFGPMDLAQARQMAANDVNAMCWRNGMQEWAMASHTPELMQQFAPATPQVPVYQAGAVSMTRADEIDYEIFGNDTQFVEIELDPGESAVAEAGAMMFKDASITMNAVFGDGSGTEGGFMGKLLGAGKRLLTGESLFTTVFTHQGQGKARVAFAAPYSGTIIPISLATVPGGMLVCQKDSFLAAARGVSIGIYFQRKILTGLFGGEGFVMQKLEGDGMVFVHAGGTLKEIELDHGDVLHVDTGCVVAFEPSVNFEIVTAGGIKSMLFGGEGVFFAELKGPGRVWVQSLPFSRLAGRMLQAVMPQGSKDEGSVLGSVSNMFER